MGQILKDRIFNHVNCSADTTEQVVGKDVSAMEDSTASGSAVASSH